MNQETKSGADVAHAVIRGSLAGVPFAGGLMSTLFEEVFQRPLDKRRQAWLIALEETVDNLTKKVDGLSAEHLASNERFLTAAVQAAQIAQRSHQEEKLEALRNAVYNSALPSAPGDDLQMMFLRFVDELTVLHLRIMYFLDAPRRWFEINGRSPEAESMGVVAAVVDAFPSLASEIELVKQVISDLQAAGLLKSMSLRVIIKGEESLVPRTTKLGRDFISFISKQASAEPQMS